MNQQQKRTIEDNPNLSHAVLARLIKTSSHTVRRFRNKSDLNSNWTYKGFGVPFSCDANTCDGTYREVKFNGRIIHRGNHAMLNLDRLMFCLENNNGKLPRTLSQCVFDDLEFIRGSEDE